MKCLSYITQIFVIVFLMVSSVQAVKPPSKEEIDAKKKSVSHVIIGRLHRVYESREVKRIDDDFFTYKHFILAIEVRKVERAADGNVRSSEKQKPTQQPGTTKAKNLAEGDRIFVHDFSLTSVRHVGDGPTPAVHLGFDWSFDKKGSAPKLYLNRRDDGHFDLIESE